MAISAIPVFVGPLVRSRHTKPSPTYFEVSFMNDIPPQRGQSTGRLDAIVFRNYYCSHLTIKQRRQSAGTAGHGVDGEPWVTVLRDRPLMEDPHYEDDAQYWHVITVDEFDRTEYDAESTAPLRFYLYQPSPMWKTFGLHHVKCVSSRCADTSGGEPDRQSFLHGGAETDADLRDLERGLSEQVHIFSDRQRERRTS